MYDYGRVVPEQALRRCCTSNALGFSFSRSDAYRDTFSSMSCPEKRLSPCLRLAYGIAVRQEMHFGEIGSCDVCLGHFFGGFVVS